MVRLPDGTYLIQTLDFFTPIVDDPYTFGAIAAANSLSDVYAMGATPMTAMNILCWDDTLPEHVLQDILLGGFDKVRESGALLVGGHSVTAPELKFGLSVTAICDRYWANEGARPGDVLVLTKALGTGVISTAFKMDSCPEDALAASVESMLTLNADAAARAQNVHACTDISGFGLMGHAFEIARSSGVRIVLDTASLPLLPHAQELAAAKFLTRGDKSNRRLVGDALSIGDVDPALVRLVADPQTSGGLLIALSEEDAVGLGPIVGRVEAGPVGLHLR